MTLVACSRLPELQRGGRVEALEGEERGAALQRGEHLLHAADPEERHEAQHPPGKMALSAALAIGAVLRSTAPWVWITAFGIGGGPRREDHRDRIGRRHLGLDRFEQRVVDVVDGVVGVVGGDVEALGPRTAARAEQPDRPQVGQLGDPEATRERRRPDRALPLRGTPRGPCRASLGDERSTETSPMRMAVRSSLGR